MSEEIKEPISKAEQKRLGDMFLELRAQCPHVPKDANIKYNAKDVGKCVYILTAGDSVRKYDITGGFTSKLKIQVAYQSFPTGNGQIINAQDVSDSITMWLEDVENLPVLKGGRKVTNFTAYDSFSSVEEVEGDKATVFAANADMEYRVKGERF